MLVNLDLVVIVMMDSIAIVDLCSKVGLSWIEFADLNSGLKLIVALDWVVIVEFELLVILNLVEIVSLY